MKQTAQENPLFKKIFHSNWFYPLTLFAVMMVAYGLQIFRLGFYWDDWQAVYLINLHDMPAYWQYFLYDRPFSAWTYLLTAPILGLSPLRWQLFTLLIRWAGILSFGWCLTGIWPNSKWQIRWIGYLLAVFPGFTQQAVSLAYSQHFLTFALFTTSLGLMVWSLRQSRSYWLFALLSWLTALMHLLTMEYFLGLELLRPVILAIVLWNMTENKKISKKVILQALKHWLPYLLVLVAFLMWRFVIYVKISPDPNINAPILVENLAASPINTILHYLQISLQDFIHINTFTWLNTIHPETIELTAKSTLFSWVAGLLTAALVAGYLYLNNTTNHHNDTTKTDDKHFTLQSIILGTSGVFLGGIPIWATNRQIILGMWSDRFSLAPMIGATILIVSLTHWLGKNKNHKTVFLTLLLGFSIAAQIRNTNKYRLNWELQKDYYWQLSWRAPALEEGTSILAAKMPFGLISDYAIGFAINTFYDTSPEAFKIPYWFLSAPRYEGTNIPAFENDHTISYDLRNILFEGSTSDSLVVAYNPARGCLRVLDDAYRDVPPLSDGDSGEYETRLIEISHPENIISTTDIAKHPPEVIFGKEPSHEWCYYYQKADLARQNKQWDTIVTLGKEAANRGYFASNGVELIPFVEGSALSGDWQSALDYSQQAEQLTEDFQPVLCNTWQRIKRNTESSPEQEETLEKAWHQLGCGTD